MRSGPPGKVAKRDLSLFCGIRNLVIGTISPYFVLGGY